MATVSWLHLTDLHLGLAEQQSLWPNVRELFFNDLRRHHDRTGPWDLILFTGDLTQRGTEAEFARIHGLFDELSEFLFSLGSTPVLLAVPGNHDLVRPSTTNPTTKALATWNADPDIGNQYWRKASNPYNKLIDKAFGNFSRWAATVERPSSLKEFVAGRMPGDFCAAFEKDGLRLGIVGLNSAFLQLGAGQYQGKLALDPRQMSAACGGDAPQWLAQQHASLLLTHHPPEWLDARCLSMFRAEINPPGRFAAHLCGHLHEPRALSTREGGASPRRTLQATSLFGLEKWDDGSEGVIRLHGYACGRLCVEGEKAEMRVWPRILSKQRQAGHWRMVPDTDNYDLEDGESFSEQISLTRPLALRPGVVHGLRSAGQLGADASTMSAALQTLISQPSAPDRVTETLLGNLLRVKERPEHIWGVPTGLRLKAEAKERLPPYILKEGALFAFSDPSTPESPFSSVVERGPAIRYSASDWLADASRARWYLELLNVSLKEHLYHSGVSFERRGGRFYFRPRKPGRSVIVGWIGSRKRTVVRAPDRGKGGYWVHQAAHIHFEHIGPSLYVVIEPSWFFTTDGRTPLPSEAVGPLTTKWSGPERNGTILRHVLMWCNLLTSSDGGRVKCGSQFLAFSHLPATAMTDAGLASDRIAMRALLELTRIEHKLTVPPSSSFAYRDDVEQESEVEDAEE